MHRNLALLALVLLSAVATSARADAPLPRFTKATTCPENGRCCADVDAKRNTTRVFAVSASGERTLHWQARYAHRDTAIANDGEHLVAIAADVCRRQPRVLIGKYTRRESLREEAAERTIKVVENIGGFD